MFANVCLATLICCGLASALFAAGPLRSAQELPAVATLPDPFTFTDGSRVKNRADWERRRAEIRQLFQDYQYGQLPPRPEKFMVHRGTVTEDVEKKVTRQSLKLSLQDSAGSATLNVQIITPIGTGRSPLPVVIRGSFFPPGSATRIGTVPTTRPRQRPDDVTPYISRGYAIAEFSFPEVAIDDKENPRTGALYNLYGKVDCGTLMAWAWGFHRVVDALLTLDNIDPNKIAVTGHSRFGKAALLAGAFDDRIALTVPSHSGCAGAAPYRFLYGKCEAIENAVGYAPQWFSANFRQFIGNVQRLPFDQHLLHSLIAPRALLSTEGTQDAWTNPQGSQLTHLAAREAYRFLGAESQIAIHFRPVGHIPSDQDLLDFADHVFTGKPLPPQFNELPYPIEPGGYSWKAPAP